MKNLLIALSCAVLTACGGGGSSEPPAAPPPPPPSYKVVIVDAFGDSTMLGVGTSTAPTATAQAVLVRDVNPLTQVRNEAVSGTRSGQLLLGTDGRHQPWAMTMASSSAQIVVVNHGINDVVQGTTVEDYRRNLEELARGAKAAGKRMVFDTPNPGTPGGSQSDRVPEDRLALFAQIMRDVAAQEGAVLCDQYKTITEAGMNTLQYLPDGIHPSPALYEFKGKTLAACLSPLVKE